MKVCLLISAVALASAVQIDGDGKIKPDAVLVDYVKSHGYPVERHNIQTDDKVTLVGFRIPRPGAPVVFVQHGLLDSSWGWFAQDSEKSLPFVLYNAGYDVWLGNSRGNLFSTLPKCKGHHDKWDFSFETMGLHDVPANVDYVLNATQQKDLTFFGHSQGHVQFMVAALAVPNLASKINLYAGVGPVVYLGNSKSPALSPCAHLHLDKALYALDKCSFLDSAVGMRKAEEFFCKISAGKLCRLSLDFIAGTTTSDDRQRLENFISHAPAGCSSKDLVHFAQYINKKWFARFDYGKHNNDHYGADTPPLYNLTEFPSDLPLALFFGSKDLLVEDEDRARQLTELAAAPSNPVVFHNVYDNFGHLTWEIGDNSTLYWQDDLLMQIQKYNAVEDDTAVHQKYKYA